MGEMQTLPVVEVGLKASAGTVAGARNLQQITPLCVDLDGTLLRSDMLIESVLLYLKRSPWGIFRVFGWLVRGRAHLKAQLAQHVEFDWNALAYDSKLLKYLTAEALRGRRLYLVTASHESIAKGVSAALGIFVGEMGSTEELNLKGKNKAQALIERFGEKRFAYIGDSLADTDVWKVANEAIAVNPSWLVRQRLKKLTIPVSVIVRETPQFSDWVKALRVYQWAKNVLVFVPILASHHLFDWNLWSKSALAWLAFSLCASHHYLLNDILDVKNDRTHPTKRNRPIASGKISVASALLASSFLLAGALAIAWPLAPSFFALLLIYVAAALSYSVFFKKVVILDVVILASLYTLRIFSGCAATGIRPSFWLLTLSVFGFSSLAMLKRYCELQIGGKSALSMAQSRGYLESDRAFIFQAGLMTSFLSILVLCLYFHDPLTMSQYPDYERLWLISPISIYWICRTWLLASRRAIDDDFLLFMLRDRASYAVLVSAMGIATWAAF